MSIDIDQSFYNDGTATIETGGLVVRGLGTIWQGAVRAGDMFGTHCGSGVRIRSVDSNTQLTLAYPWPLAAQANTPYEIQFTPYDAGYQPAVRKLLSRLTNGNLDAFSSLAGSVDKIPYFTGAGAMDLIDLALLGGGGSGGGNWDALTGTLAGRDAFNGEASGFRLLVADNGNGQAVIYQKTGAGATEWSAAVPFTGPRGKDGQPNKLTVGSVTEGEQAYVSITGTAPNQIINFVLRRGEPGPMGDVTPEALAAKEAAETAARKTADDVVLTGNDAKATAADRVATGDDVKATAADRVATGNDVKATGQDKDATAVDRRATGENAKATAADRVATGDDVKATAADRIATGNDLTATGQDKNATAADRRAVSDKADLVDKASKDVFDARDDAHEWANAPHGAEIAPGQYSARHYAKEAETAAGGGIQKINGKTGAEVTLEAADVGAATDDHTHADATATADGFMAAADKKKLNDLPSNADKTNAASVGAAMAAPTPSTTIADGDKFGGVLGGGAIMATWSWGTVKAAIKLFTDTLYASKVQGAKADTALQTLNEGANVSITGSGDSRTISVDIPPSGIQKVNGKTGSEVTLDAADVGAATDDHTHTSATATAAGFMAAADKKKLDDLPSNADKTNAASVGAAMAAPTPSTIIADGDKFGGILGGGVIMATWSWGTVKAAIKLFTDTLYASKGQGAKADTAVQPAALDAKQDKLSGTSAQITLANGASANSIPPAVLGLTYNLTAEFPVPVTLGSWLYLTDGTNYGLKQLKELPASDNVVAKAGDTGLGGFSATVAPTSGNIVLSSTNPQNIFDHTNVGAMTITAPSTAGAASSFMIFLTNSASAGSVTFVGFPANGVKGDTVTAGAGKIYCITVGHAGEKAAAFVSELN